MNGYLNFTSLYSLHCFSMCARRDGLLHAAVLRAAASVHDQSAGQLGPRGDARVASVPLPVVLLPVLPAGGDDRGAAGQRDRQGGAGVDAVRARLPRARPGRQHGAPHRGSVLPVQVLLGRGLPRQECRRQRRGGPHHQAVLGPPQGVLHRRRYAIPNRTRTPSVHHITQSSYSLHTFLADYSLIYARCTLYELLIQCSFVCR